MKYIYFFILLLIPVYIFAENKSKKTISIQWNEIREASGYKLQAKDEKQIIVLDILAQTNKTEIQLFPGAYELRVSALNKFGKTGKWSEWKKVNVQASTDKQEVSFQPKKQEEKSMESAHYPFWKKLVPGLGQWDSGDKKRAVLYWTLFVGMSGFLYSEKKSGDAIASQNNSGDGYTASLITVLPLQAGVFAYMDKQEQEQKYNEHAKNQRTLGAGIALLYIVHITDIFYFRSFPGGRNTAFNFSIFPNLYGDRSEVYSVIRWETRF